MPVTFKIAAHEANEVNQYKNGDTGPPNAQDVVSRVWHEDGVKCEEMLQSSYQPNEGFVPNSNGFINSIVRAYNTHHHLIIRPDDIWTSILSQMNFYVNAHAEELRSKFVAHEGKKELYVEVPGRNRYSADFGKMAQIFGELLKENILDPSLHDWIVPNFTTTTPNDVVVCSVMMMSTLKAYFAYAGGFCCGIPSITLLGEKEDYLSILQRTEKLAEFGEEPAAFARLLQPILREFAQVFEPGTPDVAPFWSRICHHQSGGSGPSYLGGWATAFSVWSAKGKWLGGDLKDTEKSVASVNPIGSRWGSPPPFSFAGLRYPVIDTSDIPEGFCNVDVKLIDNGEEFECKMVAEHVGYMVSAQKDQMDTLQPSSHWFMFIKGKNETQAEAMERMMARFRAPKAERGRA